MAANIATAPRYDMSVASFVAPKNMWQLNSYQPTAGGPTS